MLKGLKRLICVIMLTGLTLTVFFACSSSGGNGGKGETKNSVYVIKAADFSGFQKNMLPSNGGWYTVPAVDELSAGESYYVVAHTVAETLDGSAVKFSDSGLLEIRDASSTMLMKSDVKVEDYGVFTSDGVSAEITCTKETDGMIGYRVTADSTHSKAEFIVYVKFTSNADGELDVKYYMNGTTKKGVYGLSSNSALAKVKIFYSKKVTLSDLMVSYLDSENYVDGRYDKTSLVDSIDMNAGRDYYMVVSANIRSMLSEENGEKIKINFKLSPPSVINGTLEEAGSGVGFSETETENEKNITVSFKLPESGEMDKKLTFIIKLSPLAEGEAKASISFSAEEISVLGTNKLEKSFVFGREETVSEGFEYMLSQDGTYYTVTGPGKANGFVFLIPSEHEGLPIKAIGVSAFSGLDGLRRVEIAEGVERIGNSAFSGCTALSTVSLPSTAKVSENAFSGCNAISSLTLNLNNAQLKTLFGASDNSIPGTLKKVTLVGDTVLCDNAFAGGKSITGISLPATLTDVGENAFSDCPALTSLSLPSQNQSFFMQCGILYEKTSNAVKGYVTKFSGELTYPDGVTLIPGGDMSGVTSITVPSSVTGFLTEAKSLAPREATGPYFLFPLINKSNITKAVVTSGTSAPLLSGATKLAHVTLAESIIKIPVNAFSYCKSLMTVEIKGKVTEIGNVAFRGCVSLSSITLPSTVIRMGTWVFQDCERLISVTMPDSLTELPEGTFGKCRSLKEVNIPSRAIKIGKSAFLGCTSLSSVTVPHGIEEICDSAFSGCVKLTGIQLPTTVKSIGNETFSESGLYSFNVPKSVTSVSASAFSGCRSLKSITVADNNGSYYADNGVLYKKSGEKWITPEGKND